MVLQVSFTPCKPMEFVTLHSPRDTVTQKHTDFLSPLSFPLSYFLKILLIYLAVPGGMWDLNSPTKDQTCASCGGRAES